MVSSLSDILCTKCTKAGCHAACSGCEQSFCERHFIKHRLCLSEQADKLHDDYDQFQQDLARNNFQYSLLSSIDTWERNSIIQIQQTAEKARKDFQAIMRKIRNEMKTTLKTIVSDFVASATADKYTETELTRWNDQLTELRRLIENSSSVSIVEDKQSQSLISAIQITRTNENPIWISPRESFRLIFGPGELSDDRRVITQSNYRAGLSQISGTNEYSSGKHSTRFLIEKKDSKNIFIGISSSAKQNPSPTFDHSLHGWWNLNHMIINGESTGDDNQHDLIQTGDELTLTIDCDHHQIQLRHHRTKQSMSISIKYGLCAFPWKILVRLHSAGDCVRILD
ncbi:unnamed protein product [Adineta ricciae]|uniref:B box-type domain-containing protein n=1 Tax=Adineta ricciae TaxID=249248 RepID=A0A816D1T1_ADIRI|nr:unnamed protein product [Adineta ricciae]